MKNVAIVISDITKSAGTERAVSNLANSLVGSDKYNVYILSVYSDINGKPFYKLNEKVKIINLNMSSASLAKRYFVYKKLLQELQSAVNQYSIEYIIGTTHAYNSLIVNLKNCKRIGCEHMNYDACKWYSQIVRKNKYPELDAVVTLTQKDSKRYTFVDKNKVFVIPNSRSFKCDKPSDLSIKRIITVGRLTDQKNYTDLVDVANILKSKIPDWHIDIFGDGELKQQLLDKINHLGLDDFISINPPTKKIKDELLNSSIYIMTSKFEGLPMILLESQACGLPIVSYDCTEGPADVVINGSDGYLVKTGDIEGAANKVLLIANDREKLIDMGKKAFIDSERFSAENVFKMWDDFFEKI